MNLPKSRMPKNIYVTFSGRAYDQTTAIIVRDAFKFGADEVCVYDDKWLMSATPFYRENRWLFEHQPRSYNGQWTEVPVKFGFGWCAWKAYVIKHALLRSAFEDVVLYTDADTFPISDIGPLFELARQKGIVLFEEQGCLNKQYTKRDCFAAMGCDLPECHQQIMACGRFQLFTTRSLGFVGEWNTLNVLPSCQLWDRSTKTEDYPEFVRHSCEQSVLTNLAWRYRIPKYRTPDQNGSGPKNQDLYPQVFFQRYCEGNRDDVSGSKYAGLHLKP